MVQAKSQIKTTEGVMELFSEAHPNQENAGAYYDGIDGATYDAFIKKINFTDPYKLVEAISKPLPQTAA